MLFFYIWILVIHVINSNAMFGNDAQLYYPSLYETNFYFLIAG